VTMLDKMTDPVIVVAIIGLFAVQLGHLVNNLAQRRNTERQALLQKRRETYFSYISAFVKLVDTKGRAKPEFQTAAAAVILIAPDAVVRRMVRQRDAMRELSPERTDNDEATRRQVELFFEIVREMRRDCAGKIGDITAEELMSVITNQ